MLSLYIKLTYSSHVILRQGDRQRQHARTHQGRANLQIRRISHRRALRPLKGVAARTTGRLQPQRIAQTQAIRLLRRILPHQPARSL